MKPHEANTGEDASELGSNSDGSAGRHDPDVGSCSWEVFISAAAPSMHRHLDAAFREGRVRVVPAMACTHDDTLAVIVVRGDAATVALLLAMLRSQIAGSRFVAVGRASDRVWVHAALLAGAAGIVDEIVDSDTVVQRVVDLSHGVSVLPVWLYEEMAANLREHLALNELEHALLAAIALGRTVVDVAADLHYSERQLRRVLSRIRARLGIRSGNLRSLVDAARRHGLI